MERYDELIDQGLSHQEADYLATRHAEGLAEDMMEHADVMRKAMRENGE